MRLSGSLLAVVSVVTLLRPAFAAETICLKSGFCLEADSHTSTANTLVLHLGSGTLEYPAQDVASINAHPVESAKESTKLSDRGSSRPEELLAKAAEQEGLGSHADFLLSVARVESGLRQSAISKKGAVGLMQLMPNTAAALGYDPHTAAENALGGATYLRSLLIRYHGDSALALAAYNAGPAAVDRFHGIPPYEETINYVTRVLREYQREHELQAKTAHSRQQASVRPAASRGQ